MEPNNFDPKAFDSFFYSVREAEVINSVQLSCTEKFNNMMETVMQQINSENERRTQITLEKYFDLNCVVTPINIAAIFDPNNPSNHLWLEKTAERV